jgi:arylsulfatase A-like enzyme
VLPIPDVVRPNLTTYDAKNPDAKFPPIEPLRPPEGAPNVLVIMLDDVGFGAPSTFGGPCNTPTFDQIAAEGLRYTRFHTTSLCSPTRQALLTGRNHHSVGMGGITEIATAAPGSNSVRPNTKAPIAETLKLNGYSTPQFGEGRVAMTQAMVFSADETTDVGSESGTPVSSDYTAEESKFTGKIKWIQLDLGADDADHFIDPDERLRIAMARQ